MFVRLARWAAIGRGARRSCRSSRRGRGDGRRRRGGRGTGRHRAFPPPVSDAVERVAAELFGALDRGDWAAAAARVHPAVAERLYRETAERIAYWMTPDGPSAEALMRDEPGMPQEVAEYLAERGRQSMREIGSFANSFPGLDAPPEEFDRLTPEGYLARYLAACDPRNRSSSNASGDDPGTPAHPRRVLLGTVMEGDAIAHVTYRITWDESQPGPLDHVDLLSMNETQGGWKAVSLDLNGLPRNMWFWVHLSG